MRLASTRTCRSPWALYHVLRRFESLRMQTRPGKESMLNLESLKSKRNSATETSGAFVLISRDICVDGDPPKSLKEMQEKPCNQDLNKYHTVIRHFPKHGLTCKHFPICNRCVTSSGSSTASGERSDLLDSRA
jgi:hypothetical protein